MSSYRSKTLAIKRLAKKYDVPLVEYRAAEFIDPYDFHGIPTYHEHREPCECPACQAGAYCIREIERVAGNCGE
jgi:hypothetical protein